MHDRERTPPNQLLQLLAPAFDLLRPQLATVEMVRKSVVGEFGTALMCRRECSLPGTIIGADILFQLPIYPDGNMMEPTRAGRDFAYRDTIMREAGGSFGNDGALVQWFPVRAVGRRL